MTGIILSGCNGKMGRAVTALVNETDDCEIICGIDLFTETVNDYPVFTSPMLIPEELIKKIQIIRGKIYKNTRHKIWCEKIK